MNQSFNRFPCVAVQGYNEHCAQGWPDIGSALAAAAQQRGGSAVVAVECYPGMLDEQVLPRLIEALAPRLVVETRSLMLPAERIDKLVQPDLTDDPVFGRITRLALRDFFDADQLAQARAMIAAERRGVVLVYGVGAALACDADLLVYADLARWEIQQRFRRDAIGNLGADNAALKTSLQYKRAFFIDWRVADQHKRPLLDRMDFLLDTNTPDSPKLVSGEAFRAGLQQATAQPFSLVPFFDPGPWGGQWMRKVCGLDDEAPNYAWCFNCVPEENSLLLRFGEHVVEVPAIDLVFHQPDALLGPAVHGRFGADFPIRFDFLDTMQGGNLSFQVHPSVDYIRQHFNMPYTQNESYYLMDADPDGYIYLGLKEGVDGEAMFADLHAAQAGGAPFDADRYANRLPTKKHDHISIPAGTVHCSCTGTMVLEISATPYIFTFKLWDWGRVGLDGLPRPVHLEHGRAAVQWDRTTDWVQRTLVNPFETVAEGKGWCEQRTGLDERQFIETRRHWFSEAVEHDTRNNVHVLCLVEGERAIVESPAGAFEPFVVNYAETFVVPAAVGRYTVRPHGPSLGKQCATLKAYVRTSGNV